jgi:hypothetical protein
MEVQSPIQIQPRELSRSSEILFESKQNPIPPATVQNQESIVVAAESVKIESGGKGEITEDWKAELEIDKLDVDWSHILPHKLNNLEACELNPIEESADKIMDLADKLEYSKELLSLWGSYWSG